MAFAGEKGKTSETANTGETRWLIRPSRKEKPLEEVHSDYLQEANVNAGARDASGWEF